MLVFSQKVDASYLVWQPVDMYLFLGPKRLSDSDMSHYTHEHGHYRSIFCHLDSLFTPDLVWSGNATRQKWESSLTAEMPHSQKCILTGYPTAMKSKTGIDWLNSFLPET